MKKIPRSGALEKKGSLEESKDAAHKFSWGLLNVIETRRPGPPYGEAAREQLTREMNRAENLRIKSAEGNRMGDEWRDGRIAVAIVEGSPILEGTTAARAYQALLGAQTLSFPVYAQVLGDLKVYNSMTGGYYLLKNYLQYN